MINVMNYVGYKSLNGPSFSDVVLEKVKYLRFVHDH